MTKSTTRKLTRAALLGSASLALMLSAAYAEQAVEFKIESGSLVTALNEYARQSDQEILFSSDIVAGKEGKAVNGVYEPQEALEMILADTGLVYAVDDGDTVLIKDPTREAAAPRTFRVGQLDQEDAVREVGGRGEDEESVQDVIIVTGTNIRRTSDEPSPVIVYSREDIDTAGFVTTEDLLRSIPQNLDSSENSAAGVAAGNTDVTIGGTGVDLRGLGTGSTLVLVNGRRVSRGSSVERVNVGLIPVSAIERVEVLPDGASAIYGSDAVAGVVNFILRDDFEGSETTLRFGGVTEGSSQEYLAAQTLGHNWSSGNIMANYEYRRRNNLASSSRSFAEQVARPTDLIPQTERHNFFVSARQKLSENIELFADGSYVDSESQNSLTNSLGGVVSLREATVKTEQFGSTVGLDAELWSDWRGQFYASANVSDEIINTTLNGIPDSENSDAKLTLWITEAKIDGPLFQLPGGAAQLALGTQYRKEQYDVTTDFSDLDLGRDIYAAYGELFIPIVGAGNRPNWLHAFEVTVAGRFEDYSDFGSSFDPKLGLRIAPIESLSLRSSYSTSFKAPEFSSLARPVIPSAVPGAFFAPFPDGTPAPDTLLVGGGNPDLGPEESRSLSFGFDYRAPIDDTLTISATYFDVVFDDRLDLPTNGSVLSAFADPAVLGAFLNTSPTQSEIDDLFASPGFRNLFGVTPDTVGAIGSIATQNTAKTETNGIDFAAAYSKDTGVGVLSIALSGVYLLEYESQATATAPTLSLLDTVGNPVDLRMRGSVGLASDEVAVFAAINYVDDYISRATGVEEPVESWTTVDLNLQWELGERFQSELMNDTQVALSFRNLFNEDPPFVARSGTAAPAFFDGRNANALGRFMAIQLKKTF